MRKAVVHGGVRLLAAPQAFEPVLHVVQIVVADAGRWQLCLARCEQVGDLPFVVRARVVFVDALFFDDLIPRAAFATDVQQRGLFPM